MPPPNAKDDWIAAFLSELTINLDPGYPLKHATRIAHIEWATSQHLDPRKAARLWHAKRPSSK